MDDTHTINYRVATGENDGSYRCHHNKYAAKKADKIAERHLGNFRFNFLGTRRCGRPTIGNTAELYELETASGKILSKINMHNVRNKDWEALTQCDSFIYIGDIGNNSDNRKNSCVYRI